MKLVLKIVGGVILAGLGLGAFLYYDSLKIEGEPSLTACWPVDLYDNVTGEKVVGVEDLDFDTETGTIFMSAYDRRAVAREIEEGEVTTQGGIYAFNVAGIPDEGALKITDLSSEYKKENEFRPHGFDFSKTGGKKKIVAVNRKYERQGGGIILSPEVESFVLEKNTLKHSEVLFEGELCDPYDLAQGETYLLVTDHNGSCDQTGDTAGTIKFSKKYKDLGEIGGLTFPNGITTWRESKIAVSLTLDNAIRVYDFNPEDKGNNTIKLETNLELSGGPDNLTVDKNNFLYVAVFPNLLDQYFYMKDWFLVKRSLSVVYRISPEDYSQELLYKGDGNMISGATVALRAGDYLIMGAAWDDHIAICSGMDGLD